MKILKYPYSKPDLTKDDTDEVLKVFKKSVFNARRNS